MDPSRRRFRAQDVSAHDRVGPLELRDEAPGQLGPHPLGEARELPRRPVARQQHATAGIQHVLHGVEELELGLHAAFEELDVLDDQQSDRPAVALLEILGASVPHRGHELARELLGGRVDDTGAPGESPSAIPPRTSGRAARGRRDAPPCRRASMAAARARWVFPMPDSPPR